jgi:hypothetical protein
MNEKEWKAGENMDFRHADAVDTSALNQTLWQDRMGAKPMPPPQHNVFAASRQTREGAQPQHKKKEKDLD